MTVSLLNIRIWWLVIPCPTRQIYTGMLSIIDLLVIILCGIQETQTKNKIGKKIRKCLNSMVSI